MAVRTAAIPTVQPGGRTEGRSGLASKVPRGLLARAFLRIDAALDRVFPTGWNPLHHLGAIGFFLFWIVVASGVYLYVFFETSVEGAYSSVERLTHDQWFGGGVLRSFHRYASDALVAVALLHLLREVAFDRYRGARAFSWVTGAAVLLLLIVTGINGYWLVWDQLAHFIAVVTSEWLDWLPIFKEPMARNFLTRGSIGDRFFTLLVFLHIMLPLLTLLGLWLHVQRLSKPDITPRRGLAVGILLGLLALSLIEPALSHAPADLASMPAVLGLDWFYLAGYPLVDLLKPGPTWALVGGAVVLLVAAPWLPPKRREPVAVVDLGLCNGCGRCAADCPYQAVQMVPRTDGRPLPRNALVDPDLCVSCGICVGACPTATPFRSAQELVTAIDLPQYSLDRIRTETLEAVGRVTGTRRMVAYACTHAVDPAALSATDVAVVGLTCIAQLPPSFIDFLVTRGQADGVLLVGCQPGECGFRLGVEWTAARLGGSRDPYLRERVPRERIRECWITPGDTTSCKVALDRFRADLESGPRVAPATAMRNRPLAYVGQAAVYAGFALFVGYFASNPTYRNLDAGQAVVKLSFSHAGQPKGECRTRTSEELAALPQQLRQIRVCPRERLPIAVELLMDGRVLYSRTLEPAGLSRDGSATVYERFAVPAGKHRLAMGLRDSARSEGFDYTDTTDVSLAPAQVLTVDFDSGSRSFKVR